MALKVGELFAEFGIDSSAIDNALASVEKKCINLAKPLALVGTAFSVGVTSPIKNAAKAIYTAGTDFYGQMSRVGAISKATEDDMEKLTNKALEMASQSSFTTLDAATALEYMGMAGWKAEEMMAGLAPIMNLAAASGENLGSVSDIVTDALTAFSLTAEDAAHFSDVLAATSTSANTNVGKMGNTFKMVAPLAGALGYSIDDVAVAIGLMANAGIKGEMAGTQLRNVLSNLAKPTDDQAQAMEELGISLTDASGNMLSFGDQLSSWRTAMKGMSAEQKAYYATVLAGKEGMAGFLALINATDEDLAELQKSIEECDGATENMAKTMLDNAKGDVTLFTSAIDSLEVKLWGLAEDGFRSVVQKGTQLVNTFAALDSSTQLAVMKMAGLAAATGPVLVASSALIAGVGKLVPFLAALAGPAGVVALGLGMMAVAAVDANNDIGKTLVSMAKAGKKQLRKFDQSILTTFANIRKRMPALAGSAVTAIKEIVPAAVDSAGVVIGSIMDTFTSNAKDFSNVATSFVTSFVNGLAKNLPTLLPKAAQMVTSIASAVISNAPELLKSGVALAGSIWDGLTSTNWAGLGTQIWTAIKGAFSETGDWIKQSVLGEEYTPDSSWSEVGSKMWSTIKTGISDTGDWIKSLVMGDDYTPNTTWSEVGGKIWATIKSGISETADWLSNLVGNTKIKLSETDWSAVGSDVWAAIKKGITATGDWLKDLLLKTEFVPDGASWLAVGEKIVGAILDNKAAKAETLTSFLSGLVSSMLNSVDWASLGTQLGALGTKIIEGITTAISGIGNVAAGGIDMIGDALGSGTASSMLKGLENFAVAILEGAAAAIPDLSEVAKKIVTSLGTALANIKWADALDSVSGIAGALIDAIVAGLKGLYGVEAKIFTALADVIGKIDWADLADSASSMAGNLLDGILSGMAELTPDISELMNAIGRGIAAAGDALGTAAGTIVGNIVKALITPENWTKLIQTGATIVEGIATGIINLGKGILEGAWSFVSGTFKGLFNALGIGVPEWTAETEAALASAGTVINEEGTALVTSMEDMIAYLGRLNWVDGMNSGNLSSAMQMWKYIVSNGTDELIASLDQYAFLGCQEITNLFTTLCDETKSASDRAAAMIALNDLGFDQFVVNSFANCDKDIQDAAEKMSKNGVTTFEQAFSVLGITIPDAVKAGMEAGLPFVEACAAAVASTASTTNDKATAEAAASATGTAVTNGLATAETNGESTVTSASEGIVDASTLALETLPDLAAIVGEDATKGMSDAIDNGKSSVETSMDSLAADVVAAAAAEMSYDTGYTVGFDYTSGIIAGITANAGVLISRLQNALASARGLAVSIMSSAAGNSIGMNFSQGIANGISSYSGAITNAARRAARSALTAAKSALGIHSPSRVAEEEVGSMWDLGIANGMIRSISAIEAAGHEVAEAMRNQMYVGDPGQGQVLSDTQLARETAEQTATAAAANSSGKSNDRELLTAFANMIHNAVSNITLRIDGERVAEVVAPSVSEIIANEAAPRRFAT